MDREEWENRGICAQCGTTLIPGRERGYEFGMGSMLCWSCAVERGGSYDEVRDIWTVSPDVADLPPFDPDAGPVPL